MKRTTTTSVILLFNACIHCSHFIQMVVLYTFVHRMQHFTDGSTLTMSLWKNCLNSINLFKCEIFSTIQSTPPHTLYTTTTTICKLILGDFSGCLYLDNILSISFSLADTQQHTPSFMFSLFLSISS